MVVKNWCIQNPYLQRCGFAVNDILISANGRDEAIHFAETVIVADFSVLLKTKDCKRSYKGLARPGNIATRVFINAPTFHAAYRRFMRRKNISLSRDTFAMVRAFEFTHAAARPVRRCWSDVKLLLTRDVRNKTFRRCVDSFSVITSSFVPLEVRTIRVITD